MKKNRGKVAIALAFGLLLELLSTASISEDILAKKKIVLNKSSLSIEIGKSKTLFVKNLKKKPVWKITSGKNRIKIKKNGNKLRVTGVKKGSSRVSCKVSSKSLVCKIKITKKSKTSGKDTQHNGVKKEPVETNRSFQIENTEVLNTPHIVETGMPIVTSSPKVQITARPTHIPTDDRLIKEVAKGYYDGFYWNYSFFGTDIRREGIELLKISDNIDIPDNAIATFDLSEKQNGSVMAWCVDYDNNNKYEMTIGQMGGVIANPDSSFLFADIYRVEGLENLYTSDVVDMSSMFYDYGPGIDGRRRIDFYLDLGDEFDTSKVEKMAFMFRGVENTYTKYLRFGKKFRIDNLKPEFLFDDLFSGVNTEHANIRMVVPNEAFKEIMLKHVSDSIREKAAKCIIVEES